MEIYNQEKTQILTEENTDFTKGFFQDDTIEKTIPGREEEPEEGHYEIVAVYENGGKDVEWIVDKPGVLAEPEKQVIENIKIFIPYTEDELKALDLYEYSEEEWNEHLKDIWMANKQQRIYYYEDLLTASDYKAIKYMEGWYTEDEYRSYKEERQFYRLKINQLEELEYIGNEDIDFENF